MAKILVSACLLGFETRYDGKSRPCQKVLELAEKNTLIPVCPEQMGGLTTPRLPSERQAGMKKVLMKDGSDVTENYNKGAKMTLEIAKLNKVDYCIMKSGSPSCGKGLICDGSFSGKKIKGRGTTTALLEKHGFKVITEEEL